MSLLDLELNVASLEAENADHEATKALLCQEIEEVKHDMREVVSKVVTYACMELLHSDEFGRLVEKLVSLAITFGRCMAYEQVAKMKEPFNLSKVKGYRPLYEKEHTQASNDLTTTTFSWLNKYVASHSAETCSFEDPDACAFFLVSYSNFCSFFEAYVSSCLYLEPSPSPNE
nr:hypothetical protein [Tanacetum cinerariifolium]